MKYFIDCEFLEGTQTKRFLGFNIEQTKPTIDLISIGIVAEDDREYYAISKDFNLKEAWNRYNWKQRSKDDIQITPALGTIYKEYWIRENVLKPIFDELYKVYLEEVKSYNNQEHIDTYFVNIEKDFTYPNLKKLLNKYGKTNKQIAEEVKRFVYNPESVRPLGTEKPINFYGYYCDYDWVAFCWLFGKMIDLPKGFPMYCNDLKQTLDEKARLIPFSYDLKLGLSSIKMLKNYPKQTDEHNALADAKWNKKLYEFLNSL